MNENVVDRMMDSLERHHERIQQLTPQEIVETIKELKEERHIWSQIPSGNRDYLEAVVRNPTPAYCAGAIPHLIKALSHRMGFIASKIRHTERIGDPAFDAVIEGRIHLSDLSDEKLVQFVRDFIHSTKIKHLLRKQAHNLRTLGVILDGYDRRHAQNVDEASAYLRGKRASISNLLVKSLLPNLMGAIARS